MADLIERDKAIDAVYKCTDIFINNLPVMVDKADVYKALAELPSAQPEPQWIPVTPETLPEHNSVVIAYLGKGTWDYGMYRGHMGDIHDWHWKKNTVKYVLYWMYKEDALPSPF